MPIMVKMLIVPITIYIAVSIFSILSDNYTFSIRGEKNLPRREHGGSKSPLFPLRLRVLCAFV
jgi:hypothetical protein